MADSIKIPTRSNHGCWTCRLRRKKCDERHPVCSVCVSLELQCHGYGPRPEWMDNGALQRDQVAKVKSVVSQTKSRKGRRQQSLSDQTSLASRDVIDLSLTENLFAPMALAPDVVGRQVGAYDQDDYLLQSSEMDFSRVVDQAWSIWHSNDIPAAEFSLDPESYDVTPEPPQNTFSGQTLVSPVSSESIRVLANNLPEMSGGGDMNGGIVSRKRIRFPEYEIHANPKPIRDSTAHHQRSCPHGNSIHDFVGSPTQLSTLHGYTEDALFMYFLDKVFYVQYPFYQSRNAQGRGWLLSILRKIKAAYHGALALSERHLLGSSSRNNEVGTSLIQLRTRNGHYDLAIQGLQKLVNDSEASSGLDRFIYSLDILTSLLQLLFFELFNGGSENWEAHLRTASNFVPVLLEAKTAATMLGETDPEHASDHLLEMVLKPEVNSVMNVLLGSFIAFDIIACASTRSLPLLKIDHLQVLNTFDISCESFTGCSNSVMALILEISHLDQWKKETQKANKLSIVDLAKRGGQIEEQLRQELAGIEDSSSSSLKIRTENQPEISRIYALSAVIYLHVVISGAYPELPEIAESVSETVIALKDLNDPSLIRHMGWPICISGCLARDDHQTFFRNLISEAGITRWTVGTCFEASGIMEECWNARNASADACDWATIMKRNGRYILLG